MIHHLGGIYLLNKNRTMSMKTFWVGDKQYIVSETTSEEKAALKESHPLLHAQYFPEVSELQKECVVYEELETIDEAQAPEIPEQKPAKNKSDK